MSCLIKSSPNFSKYRCANTSTPIFTAGVFDQARLPFGPHPKSTTTLPSQKESSSSFAMSSIRPLYAAFPKQLPSCLYTADQKASSPSYLSLLLTNVIILFAGAIPSLIICDLISAKYIELAMYIASNSRFFISFGAIILRP